MKIYAFCFPIVSSIVCFVSGNKKVVFFIIKEYLSASKMERGYIYEWPNFCCDGLRDDETEPMVAWEKACEGGTD